jgi:hypothetical protein
MAIIDEQSATITVPADYLEEMRSAVVAELHNDGNMLRTNQAELVSSRNDQLDVARADRESAVRLVRDDVALLDQLLAATENATVTATRATLFHALEAMGRLLVERLQEKCDYAPLDMTAVLDLASRLGWSAEQALRIYPEPVSSTEAVA